MKTVQRQISEDIFAVNGHYRVNYPGNIPRNIPEVLAGAYLVA